MPLLNAGQVSQIGKAHAAMLARDSLQYCRELLDMVERLQDTDEAGVETVLPPHLSGALSVMWTESGRLRDMMEAHCQRGADAGASPSSFVLEPFLARYDPRNVGMRRATLNAIEDEVVVESVHANAITVDDDGEDADM